ncbi:MAG: hypothetical protein R3E82_01600 [Pseudomonadales bacterium]|nr:hypothetical protein [Pseudomonadales bacterium]
MQIRTLLILLLATALCLGGCSSKKAIGGQFSRSPEMWFCQPDATGKDWDCADDPAAAQAIEHGSLRSP